MQINEITDHTANILNLMMDKAIKESDPAYGHLADTWYTMAEGALFLWQELADSSKEASQEEKNKMAQYLCDIINIDKIPLLSRDEE